MKLIFIALAVLTGIYDLVLNVIRYRSANNPTPENMADVYDAETYVKWKKYSAEQSRLAILTSIISCVIEVVLLATNAYSAFASLFGEHPITQLFAIILLVTAVNFVTGVVRSYIMNMVIEQKYGFNKTTIKTFITDCIRDLILNFGLSFGLACLIYGVYGALGAWMILVFAAVVFAFTMVMSFLYPIFSRIGNKFTPLEDGELKDKLLALLEKHGYKVKAIEVMDASRRTTKLNAYFTGFGKMKTIVLYDNLLNAMTTEEICAIFAHEMGHGLNKDVLKGQILNIGNMLLMAVAVYFAASVPEFYTSFGFDSLNFGFTYVLTGILLGVIQPLTALVMNARSRKAEYRADAQAVIEGYGDATVTAFKKLARDNFAHLAPSRINVVLEYSHPPLAERIAAVEKLMAKK
jgi:STE24 endopeptidase